MKSWMLILSFVAVLGFSGLADAKGTKHAKGFKGTITAVNGATFTMTTAAKKKAGTAGHTYTVNSASANVTGGTLAVGAKVSVQGTLSGETITAATITIGKHKKK